MHGKTYEDRVSLTHPSPVTTIITAIVHLLQLPNTDKFVLY